MSAIQRTVAVAALTIGALTVGASPMAAQSVGDPARGRQYTSATAFNATVRAPTALGSSALVATEAA